MNYYEVGEFASNHFVTYCYKELNTTHHHLDSKLAVKEKLLSELTPFLNKIFFLQRINYSFKDKNLLLEALTHSSFAYEFQVEGVGHPLESNERLEFLGDSIINFIVGLELYKQYPQASEGNLSIWRGQKVNREYLAKVAHYLQLENLILLGKGDFKQHSYRSEKVLSSTLEALIGAVFLDSSFDECQNVFLKILENGEKEGYFSGLDHFSESSLTKDPKSTLQEILMKKNIAIQYHDIGEKVEEDGRYQFEVAVLFDGQEVIRGKDVSKKQLQKRLAQEILDKKIYQHLLS